MPQRGRQRGRVTASGAYWNHNTAYHPMILAAARTHRGLALDVGCGDGLLAERLAAVCDRVTAIDPDPASVERARARVARLDNVEVACAGLLDLAPEPRFDLISCVAVLHHLDTLAGLERLRALLWPGGEVIVIGLTINRSLGDWLAAGMRLPLVRLADWHHGAPPNLGVRVRNPSETLAEIRAIAAKVLPGATLRQGLYYRYVLRWRAPS